MDRSELERQKAAEMQERSRVVLAWTRNYISNVSAGRLSSEGIPPAELTELKEEVSGPEFILDSEKALMQDLKIKELEPNNSVVVLNMVPSTSPNENLRTTQPGAFAVPGIELQGKRQRQKGLALASAEEMSHSPALQGNQRKGRKERGRRATSKDVPSLALASAEEISHPPAVQLTRRQERERREKRANDEEEDTSSDEEMRPGAVAMAGLFTGRTSPSVLSESQAPSASEPFLIIAELAEASQEDEELRRRMQELEQEDEDHRRRYRELEQMVNGAVQGTVVVENGGGGDHDQTAASSPFGAKGTRFWIGAALALLLVVGVILGVTIALITKKPNESVVTPTQSPAPTNAATQSPSEPPAPTRAPTKAPTAAPTVCSRECQLRDILLRNKVLGAETLQDDSSPQSQALHWLANDDDALDLKSTSDEILVERYVLAVLFYATDMEGGSNVLNFLKAAPVCEWKGVTCNANNLTVALDLVNNQLKGSIPSELGELTSLTKLTLNGNKIKGSIPSELGKLTSLTRLTMYDNPLTGSIPSELGELRMLIRLGLCDNELTGSIPSELGELTSLTGLLLHTNQLTGSIPGELGELALLTTLELHKNGLTGDLDPSFCDGSLLKQSFLNLGSFKSDCSSEVVCSCCNECF